MAGEIYLFVEDVPLNLGIGNKFELSTPEAHHALGPLRLKEGKEVHLLNGTGLILTGELRISGKDLVSVSINRITQARLPVTKVTLGICILDSRESMEWIVEKGVELGITKLSFLKSARASYKPINEGRLRKLMISALKQSGSPWMPQLEIGSKLVDFLNSKESTPGCKRYIAHCETNDTHKLQLNELQQAQEVYWLIGPEGDFTQEEVSIAKDEGWQELWLGDTRLRTETAAMLVMSASRLVS